MSVAMHLLPRLKVDSIQTRLQIRESEMPLVCRMTRLYLITRFLGTSTNTLIHFQPSFGATGPREATSEEGDERSDSRVIKDILFL